MAWIDMPGGRGGDCTARGLTLAWFLPSAHPLLGAGRSSGGKDLDIVDVSRFPRLAADSVIETEMGSEIPRGADLRDHCDGDERDQGAEQSDGARPSADRRKGEGQE